MKYLALPESEGLDPVILEAMCSVGVAYPELCCALLAEATATS